MYQDHGLWTCSLQYIPSGRQTCLLIVPPCFSFSEFDCFDQVVVGTKSGEILIYDIASSTLIDTIQAHTSTIWSIQVHPDEHGLVSGSADKDVKFWDLEQKAAAGDSVRIH